MPGSYPVSVSQAQVAISWGDRCARTEGTALKHGCSLLIFSEKGR